MGRDRMARPEGIEEIAKDEFFLHFLSWNLEIEKDNKLEK
jgi:hypothetical protein